MPNLAVTPAHIVTVSSVRLTKANLKEMLGTNILNIDNANELLETVTSAYRETTSYKKGRLCGVMAGKIRYYQIYLINNNITVRNSVSCKFRKSDLINLNNKFIEYISFLEICLLNGAMFSTRSESKRMLARSTFNNAIEYHLDVRLSFALNPPSFLPSYDELPPPYEAR